jgi:penicillin-binding protein 1A
MVGGRDYRKTQFNRATQSRRQPGSAFKPIIYAAALDSNKGYTPASELLDNAVVFKGADSGKDWKPKNYDRKFYGSMLLRQALAKSRNLPTIRLLEHIGVDYAIGYAAKLGISSPLGKDLSLALGSSGVSLLELINAYSVFANQGEFVEPVFVTKIIDRDGNILEEHKSGQQQVIERSTAYLMTSLLESVVKEGTARRVLALKRPAAGKTGTTNNLHDAWFVGFTPDYITGTWVGFDKEHPLGKDETGGKAAAPIWLGFMQRVLSNYPEKPFEIPEGVVFSKIDAATGLLPTPETHKTLFECFKEGTAPSRYVNPDFPTMTQTAEDFFKSNM